MKNDDPPFEKSKNEIKNCSLRIGERLYKRITNHIQLLKRLNSIKNQQNWIEEAILARLKKEEEQDITACFTSEKHLSFKIDSNIDAQVERRVEVMKKIRGSFSKKQWILEAIHEKLDMEEMETKIKTKELFKNILKEASETSDRLLNK